MVSANIKIKIILRAERSDECLSRSADEAHLIGRYSLNIISSLAVLIADDKPEHDDSDEKEETAA
jgi:hypothetical protein